MNLLNEKVTHQVFGKGQIVAQNESIITVDFDSDTKKFMYPDAFGQFIELKDPTIVDALNEVISERLEEAAALAKEKEAEEERLAAEQARQQRLANLKIHESSQVVFWLSEAEVKDVFTRWSATTGEIQSGPNKGNPNRAVRLGPNSAALLTRKSDTDEEADRAIIGLFMLRDSFVGNMNEDGIVAAHDDFRLELTEEEVAKMPFWNYYKNNNNPRGMTWNSGRYRYYDNIITVQVLQDLIAMRTDEAAKAEAQSFLDYFVEWNVIDLETVPKPSGALTQ